MVTCAEETTVLSNRNELRLALVLPVIGLGWLVSTIRY